MRIGFWAVRVAAGVAMLLGVPHIAAAQEEAAFKGGIAVSRLTGADYWDERLLATSFGGHVRFRVGPLLLQPELHVVTKGATASAAAEDEQLRLEYVEVPALLVLPLRFGDIEVFAVGGPALMLESRCRYVIRQDGLRSNFPCDPPVEPTFNRRVFDYGLVAGAGLSHRIGTGRVLLEARHTWGMRDIHSGAEGSTVHNRTFSVMLGYSMNWMADEPR
jgi:hypothetical protein